MKRKEKKIKNKKKIKDEIATFVQFGYNVKVYSITVITDTMIA